MTQPAPVPALVTAYVVRAYVYSRYAHRWNLVNLSPVVQPYMELVVDGTRASRYDAEETATHYALHYAQREGGTWEVHVWYRDAGFGVGRLPHAIAGARAVGPRMQMAGGLYAWPTALMEPAGEAANAG